MWSTGPIYVIFAKHIDGALKESNVIKRMMEIRLQLLITGNLNSGQLKTNDFMVTAINKIMEEFAETAVRPPTHGKHI